MTEEERIIALAELTVRFEYLRVRIEALTQYIDEQTQRFQKP